ncbi:MAG: 23S rRNA (adenine(2503)-C(2))-methyltransferase RlmN [Actinomycetota bacterium]|nr:23S rRNA (adenine(2503)-C(2))-methyltransferase RlmN [Actinomycetota bacterium]
MYKNFTTSLKRMNWTKLEELIKNEPGFRIRQIERALFKNFYDNWNDLNDLPVKLRNLLADEIDLSINGQIFKSSDSGSIKALIKLDDGLIIETVLLMHKDGRNTICLSSQVGCALGCKFCKTGEIGFKRNLTFEEILLQVLFFSRYLKKINARITNVVFMGMGEPFFNYDNFLNSVKFLNDENKFSIGQRKISVSTSGITEKIRTIADENMQINLAVSINAPNDEIRRKIMPVADKYKLNELISSIKYYIDKTNRKVMIEYVLLRAVNDFPEHAEELSKRIKGLLCFVNLIPFNGNDIYKRPSIKKINEFKKILSDNKIPFTQRYEFGHDIKASCGQLIFSKSF